MVRILLETGEYLDVVLYPESSPITVANFLKLVDEKFYDGIVFHRIIKNFMAQTGGYKYNEKTNELDHVKTASNIKGEFASNGVKNTLLHETGVVSMARTAIKDSASSQFFICTAKSPHLDGEYAAFGEIVGEESFKTLELLNNAPIQNIGGGLTTFPVPVIRIASIRRI